MIGQRGDPRNAPPACGCSHGKARRGNSARKARLGNSARKARLAQARIGHFRALAPSASDLTACRNRVRMSGSTGTARLELVPGAGRSKDLGRRAQSPEPESPVAAWLVRQRQVIDTVREAAPRSGVSSDELLHHNR